MISAKLVQMIEDHSEQITLQVVQQFRKDPRMSRIARLPDSELRGRCQEILKRLGHWLAETNEEEIAEHYEALGRLRMHEDIPLHEVVHGLQILKGKMLDYSRNQGIGQNSVELYAEEELEHQVGRFFDSAVYHVVVGYEDALRQAAARVGA
jgi:hypothetical protein